MIDNEIFHSKLISEYLSAQKLLDLERDFDIWVSKYNMQEYVETPDHFAIKVVDEILLNQLVLEFKKYAVSSKNKTPGVSTRLMHGRKIATVLLREKLFFKGKGLDCIEVMQQRPEVKGTDVLGLDHVEFILNDLGPLVEKLNTLGVDYYHDDTNHYKDVWVSFLNDQKVRIKFTNRSLKEIVPEQMLDNPELIEIFTN